MRWPKHRNNNFMLTFNRQNKIELAFYQEGGRPTLSLLLDESTLRAITPSDSPTIKIIAGRSAISAALHDTKPRKNVAARTHNVPVRQVFVTNFVSWAVKNEIVDINDVADRRAIIPFGILAMNGALEELKSIHDTDIFVTITGIKVPLTYHLYISEDGKIEENILIDRNPGQQMENKASNSILFNLTSVAEPTIDSNFHPPTTKHVKQIPVAEFCRYSKKIKPLQPIDRVIVPQSAIILMTISIIACGVMWGVTQHIRNIINDIPLMTQEAEDKLHLVKMDIFKAWLQALPFYVDEQRISVHQIFILTEQLAEIHPVVTVSWKRGGKAVLAGDIDLSNGAQYVSELESKIIAEFKECVYSRGTELKDESEITFKIHCNI